MTTRGMTQTEASSIANFLSTFFDWRIDKSIKGRFTHLHHIQDEKGNDKAGDPVYSHKVELCVKGFLYGEWVLAEAETDTNGEFTFNYRQLAKSFTENEQLFIRIQKVASEGLNARLNPTVATVNIAKKFAEKNLILSKPLIVKFHEYNTDKNSYPEDLPLDQRITPDDEWFGWTALGILWPISLQALDGIAQKFGFKSHLNIKSLDELQALYNLPKEPIKYTDELLLKMITNGIAAFPFQKGEIEGESFVRIKWNPESIDQTKGAPDVPNLIIKLKETEKGLEILSITIERLIKDHEKGQIEIIDLQDKVTSDQNKKNYTYDKWTYTSDKQEWADAIQTAMSCLWGRAQLQRHLTDSHLVAGVTTFTGDKCFIKNPLKTLLDPSDEGIQLVNALGKPLIFEKTKDGDGGALSLLGLTEKGIHDEIIERMKECFALGTSTDLIERFKAGDGDTFAKGAKLTYDTFLDGIKDFMENKNNKKGILEYWNEVHYFFKNIRENRLCKNEWKIPDIAMDIKGPQGNDWEEVAKWFANYMYLASYGHNQPHSNQDIGFNPGVALSLRLDPKTGLVPKIVDPKTGLLVTSPTSGATLLELNKQYLIAKILLGFNNDEKMQAKSILKHPDVVEEVKKRFVAALKAFKALGIDLTKTPISIYI